MQYLLGLDNGGTGAKAVLFEETGRAVASASRVTPMETPKVGYTERDMELLWRMNCEAAREAIEKSGADPGGIAGVSFSGHGKGLYLWGADEKPAHPGIVSTDSRAWRIVEDWHRDGTAERAFPLTSQSVLASQPVALLKWFLLNRPEALERTKWVFGVKDYVRYRMTGEAYAEITDISGSSLVNLHSASYDGEILKLFGLESIRDKLPPLVYSAQFCGKVTAECAAQTGLAEGTPVAAGLFDIDACAIGMNIVDDRYMAAIAGTWSINEYVSPVPVLDRSVKMNSLYCLPNMYLVEECSPTSASNQEWFVNSFLKEAAGGRKLYHVADEMVEAVAPDEANIVFLPYLYGGSDDARAGAAFVNLNAAHTRAHMLRAVYEGIVFGHKLHMDRLLSSRKAPPKAVRLAGGVTNAAVWVQMFSDILEMDVETIEVKELGALGAAMTAAVAAGLYPSLAEAAKAMVSVSRVYRPNPALSEIYRRKYRDFMAVADAMAPVWGRLER
jgi:L-xylulokinase